MSAKPLKRSPGTKNTVSACRLCERLSAVSSEVEVIEALIQAYAELGYERARFYDANICPIDRIHFFTMRATTAPYPNAPLGYSIYEATLSGEAVMKGEPVFEDSNSTAVLGSEAKRRWVDDLGLQGKLWVDVPIFASRQLIGLWALDRNRDYRPSKDELADIRRIALVAGLKMHELRQSQLGNLLQKILLHYDGESDRRQILQSGCSEVAAALNASFVAYFEYDHVHGTLNKVIEIYNDNDKPKAVSLKSDQSYGLGQCLTGAAWANKELHYIPDFEKLILRHSELVDVRSKSEHENIMGRPVRSVIYQTVQIPAGWPGFLRAMNRSDDHHLRFTGQHRNLLTSVSQSLGQVLAVRESVDHLTGIWDAFSSSLARLKNEGLDYSSISSTAEKLGYPSMIVTVWREDGVLIDTWCNNVDIQRSLRILDGKVQSRDFLLGAPSRRLDISQIPSELAAVIRNANIAQVYAVKSEPMGTQRTFTEILITLFALSIHDPAVDVDSLVAEEEVDHWPQLMILDVLGRLTASSHELARNRSLLYYAEQAIGTIAHEINSPTSSLVNAARIVCQHERDLFSQLPRESAAIIEVEDVSDTGDLKTVILTGPNQNLKWLESEANKISQYGKDVRKVVNDALRWARMGGKYIELDLKTLNLHSIIKDCIYELRDDIKAKPPLKMEITEGVRKVPPFNGDKILFHQLFINLIDNAIKYSHARGPGHETKIKITAERQTAFVDIKISNWGLGIDKTDYDNIFTGFYRSSIRDRIHTVKGVGLGLSTCRRIVELHKGSISVKSDPTLNDPERTKALEGYQTTFTIRFPLTLKEGRVDVDTATMKIRGETP